MLTQSEREWLEKREVIHQCEGDYIWAGYWEEGVELEVMLEAAEFEGRVAAKLATDENCGVDEDCPSDLPFGWGRLKAARLAVEEELDGTDRSRT